MNARRKRRRDLERWRKNEIERIKMLDKWFDTLGPSMRRFSVIAVEPEKASYDDSCFDDPFYDDDEIDTALVCDDCGGRGWLSIEGLSIECGECEGAGVI